MPTHGDQIGRGVALLACLLALLFFPQRLFAQNGVQVELKTGSEVSSGGHNARSTLSLRAKRYSLGYTSTLRQGRPLGHVLAARYDPAIATKVYFTARVSGTHTDWETKVNQKLGAYTLAAGIGSDGLMHSGLEYAPHKRKGFGFQAAVVRDGARPPEERLEVWHYVESLDLTASLKRRAGVTSWSLTCGSLPHGVLRYQTLTGGQGAASSHWLIYGSELREDSLAGRNAGPLDLHPDESVFGEGSIRVKSPLVEEDLELAWLIEGFGGRIETYNLIADRRITAEAVQYLSDTIWVGGIYDFDGRDRETLGMKFGNTAKSFKLVSELSYSLTEGGLSGRFSLRWLPGRDR